MGPDGDREGKRSDAPKAELLSRASVRVGSVETWYTGWGRGAPVLVFLRDPLGWAPPFWLQALAGPNHRLLFPEVPREAWGEAPAAGRYERFSNWFSDFLDGLGLDQVEVVCETEFEAPLRVAQADHPDRTSGSIRGVIPPYRR